MGTEGSALGTAKRFTGWYIVAAILFIVLGMFAIIEPTVAGLGVAILVGWLLLFGGIAHFVMAFHGGSAKRVTYQVLLGIVFLLGGVYMLNQPRTDAQHAHAAARRCDTRLRDPGDHRLLSDRAGLGVAAVQRHRGGGGRGLDLDPLAIELGLGHRHARGDLPAGDRRDAADDGDRRASCYRASRPGSIAVTPA